MLEVQRKQRIKNVGSRSLKIEYVPIDSIKPYPGNAKLHPAEQIEQIKESIRLFGFKDPIGVWKNEVATGHGRLIAAKELGMDTIRIFWR